MKTTAEVLLAALEATLKAGSIGAPVERSRKIAFERDDLPAVVIRPKTEDSTALGKALLRCTLVVEIEVHTRGDIADQLADPIAAAIDAAVRADPTMGGLAGKTFRSGKEWDATDSDGTGGRLVISYQIHYTEPA